MIVPLRTLALLGLFLFLPASAVAFPIGDGVLIVDDGTGTTYQMQTGDTADFNCLSFDAATGAPKFDGVLLEISGGYWNVTAYAPGTMTIVATLASPATFQLSGPQDVYAVTGLGFGTLNLPGSGSSTYNLGTGAHTLTIVGSGGSPVVAQCGAPPVVPPVSSPGVSVFGDYFSGSLSLFLGLILAGAAMAALAVVVMTLQRG